MTAGSDQHPLNLAGILQLAPSQSNFYTAFREITGEVPGKFRKQRGPVRVPQAK
jgi:hypothetical protein